MIYFDNAATTLQKPESVHRAVISAMRNAAGAGRSGHRAALHAGEILLNCREELAALFGLSDCTRVVFTLNATHALNIAIHAMCGAATHVAMTAYEHNSVIRPVVERGAPYEVLESRLFHPEELLQSAENAIRKGANLFIINHVSNVFGTVAPIAALDELLSRSGIPMILDASQSAGVLDIDVSALHSVVAVCMPGHKALYGPQGTGVLLVLSDALQKTLIQGGTGSVSSDIRQPEFLPDRFESGTMNAHGVAGLLEGVRFVRMVEPATILRHEQILIRDLAHGLREMPGCEVFAASDEHLQAGVLSFRQRGMPCEDVAELLARRGICVRAGLHCAPLAHRSVGTLATGTVRASVGYWNTHAEVQAFLEHYKEIVIKK